MLDVLRNIFGTYSPVVNTDGLIPSGMAGVNMEYVGHVLLFAICLVSVFKLIGVLLRKI